MMFHTVLAVVSVPVIVALGAMAVALFAIDRIPKWARNVGRIKLDFNSGYRDDRSKSDLDDPTLKSSRKIKSL